MKCADAFRVDLPFEGKHINLLFIFYVGVVSLLFPDLDSNRAYRAY